MSDTLRSVKHALAVLTLLQGGEGFGVSEIARRLDLGVSTSHRLLATLVESRFVEQDEHSRKYRLGPAMTRGMNGSPSRGFCTGPPAPGTPSRHHRRDGARGASQRALHRVSRGVRVDAHDARDQSCGNIAARAHDLCRQGAPC
ncbi:helix-turn-helix domain-containing protein [Microbacterium sp. NIBRBAC000506063]|uniref:helix-turn-helix domain-containing protein n=1 Tax=Microbacterium sp. NIBRBAC000506063 TaxID=2734618 RepID=UPI001BB523EF|nr:helix-turn-helix domain-containing protein [Microbacterium sp. NIBRBAC000506063]